ncbi:transposase [Hydrogenophaga crassostreae]
MKKSGFSEGQIVAILKEVEQGSKVGGTCRKHGISDSTCYKWRGQ